MAYDILVGRCLLFNGRGVTALLSINELIIKSLLQEKGTTYY